MSELEFTKLYMMSQFLMQGCTYVQYFGIHNFPVSYYLNNKKRKHSQVHDLPALIDLAFFGGP